MRSTASIPHVPSTSVGAYLVTSIMLFIRVQHNENKNNCNGALGDIIMPPPLTKNAFGMIWPVSSSSSSHNHKPLLASPFCSDEIFQGGGGQPLLSLYFCKATPLREDVLEVRCVTLLLEQYQIWSTTTFLILIAVHPTYTVILSC